MPLAICRQRATSISRCEVLGGHYDRAHACDRNYAVAWHGKSNALYVLQRYKESLPAFERALTIGEIPLRWRNTATECMHWAGQPRQSKQSGMRWNSANNTARLLPSRSPTSSTPAEKMS